MKLDKKTQTEIRRLLEAGHTMHQIAQKLNLQPAVVAGAIKRLRQQEAYLKRRGERNDK